MDDFDARRASLDLVTAFVNNNKLSAGELPTLLSDVFKAISGFEMKAAQPAEPDERPIEVEANAASTPPLGAEVSASASASPAPEKIELPSPVKLPKAPSAPKPAVSVKTSLADPNVIVSLITGEKFKMLKRHLTKHGMTEAEYKARYNLPDDYPMVAPAYAELRSDVAKKMHARGRKAEPVVAPKRVPDPKIEGEAVKVVKAKSAPKTPKKVTASKAMPAKQLASRKSRTRNAGANAAPLTPVKPIETPIGGSAPQAAATPQTEAEKDSQAVAQAPAAMPEKRRRMARQPANASKSEDTSAIATLVQEPQGQNASPAPSPKPKAGKSAKASGAAVATGDVTAAKPVRKDRKKLSAKFG
jgi:predicted transcriptional regulator